MDLQYYSYWRFGLVQIKFQPGNGYDSDAAIDDLFFSSGCVFSGKFSHSKRRVKRVMMIIVVWCLIIAPDMM